MRRADIERLGRFTILGEIARGSMGVVYKATDPERNRAVAIKTLRRDGAGAADDFDTQLARFRREAEAVSDLRHANIVSILEAAEDQDVSYIVMEFIDGRSLKDILDTKEALTVETSVRIMRGLLSALAYAHHHGIIHRDIKPANILIDRTGEPKLADFGVARIESSTLTMVGTVLGTISYMAPEQLRGQRADARSDLFSAGVVFYELLTGQRPFLGTVATIEMQLLNVDPHRPSHISPHCSANFDEVVAKAMAKRPEDRYRDATEFLEAIDAALGPAAGTDFDAADATATLIFQRPTRCAPAPPPAPERAASVPIPVPVPAPAPRPTPAPRVPLTATEPVLAATERRSGAPIATIAAAVAIAVIGGGGAWWALSPQAPPAPALAPPAASDPAPVPPAPQVAAAPLIVPPPAPALPAPVVAPPAASDPAPVPPAPQVAAAPLIVPPPAPALPAPVVAPPAERPIVSPRPDPATTPEAPRLRTIASAGPAAVAATQPVLPQIPAPAPSPAFAPTIPQAQPQAQPATVPALPRIAVISPPAHPAATAKDAVFPVMAALRGVDCSLLTVDAGAGNRLLVSGTIGETVGDATVRGEIERAAPGTPYSLSLQHMAGRLCQPLAAIAPRAALNRSAMKQLILRASRGEPKFTDGDKLMVTVEGPPSIPYLQIDYFTLDGQVVHLLPNPLERDGILPKSGRRAIGDPATGGRFWVVGAPFGVELIVAVASTSPLFTHPLPEVEVSGKYLTDLTAVLERAPPSTLATALAIHSQPK